MSEPVALSLRERIEGKWQIPTLFVAVALLVGSILRLNTTPQPATFELKVAQLAARVEDGFYTSAIDHGRRLAEREDVPADQRGEIHLQLARAHYLRAERGGQTTAPEASIVQDEYAGAQEFGAALTPDDLLYLGHTHSWKEEYAAAIVHYLQAVKASPGPALDTRRRIIELAMYELDYAPADLYPLVDSFIEEAPSQDLRHLLWAAATRSDLLASEGRHEDAAAFLRDMYTRFEGTSWEDSHEYLLCLALYRLGLYDETEGRLRVLRNRLQDRDELFAKSGWLLGRVVLSDPPGGTPQRPQEALSFFREVVELAPVSVYAAAGRLGLGEALAALEQFNESLEQYRQCLDVARRHGGFPGSSVFSEDAVRASASVVGETLRRRGRIEAPLHYYEVAASLVDERDEELTSKYLQILGDLRAALARRLRAKAEALSADEQAASQHREQLLTEARYLLLEAGETFQKLAQINTHNESRSAEAMWKAAELFDEAGDTQRTIAVLDEFARERPESELMPRVLLRLGQARQALGLHAEAVETYRENLRRFPRTPDAGSGLIPLARCYMALGGEQNCRLAEKTLVDHILADSPVFTPQAPEFRDALFLLGELYGSEEQFERAIGVVEEALERYPRDERAARAGIMLADAYRRSAMALKQDISKTEKASEWPRMRAEMRARLERAVELLAELIGAFEAKGEQNLDELQMLFLMQSRLYQADCLFELGRYQQAVAQYETAAFIYRNEPPALAAYIQVVNCRLSLGQVEEARAALHRAQYLLSTMPDRVFEQDRAGQSRREWKRFFDWLEQAKLLGNVQARG